MRLLAASDPLTAPTWLTAIFTGVLALGANVRSKHPECSDDVYAAGIEFTDAAGNKWERDPYGALKER